MFGLGSTELLIVLGVVVLIFGGKKLPELARGSGRALRIFKSEVKDLGTDEPDSERDAIESAEADKKPEQG